MQIIDIELHKINNMFILIELFSKFSLELDTTLNISYNGKGFVENDVYIIICSFVNEIKARKKTVIINLDLPEDNNTINYASRIDFFKHIGVEYKENFSRHNTTYSLIEINNAEKGSYNVSQTFENIFKNDFKLTEEEIFQTGFFIDELICNMTMHSNSQSGAYYYCQKFPKTNTLEITIADCGIGIADSLSKKYKFDTNGEYLIESIKFGVTNGEGRGHGLYFVSEFIKRNNCIFYMISKENYLKIYKGNVFLNNINNWNGVILKLIINFDIISTLNSILKEKY